MTPEEKIKTLERQLQKAEARIFELKMENKRLREALIEIKILTEPYKPEVVA